MFDAYSCRYVMTPSFFICLAPIVSVLLAGCMAVANDAPKNDPSANKPSAMELKFDETSSARVEGQLAGPRAHEYTFSARKGQKVMLALSSDLSPWIGMDLLAPVFAATLKAPAVYTNFIDGSTRWEGTAPGNGTYTVRLGLLTARAKKAGRIDYELDVNIK